jgi:methionyl-tRNA synthetase
MMSNYWTGNPAGFAFPGLWAGWLSFFLIPVSIWSIFWMGWGLWRAAKMDSKVWFIVLLLIHTLGILDILYIFVISKNAKKSSRKR